ncbi:CT253 family lipoprotein [Candidatus Neptunichlamydia sp. REUL1]|uniref:CT253 family lipoprotein n=1 Tax=Candidatus Neptunichlamydia sp. REUL1 TaxID=3064277 RepID=UPI002931B6DD|nr:CT253 family lipoprotein [Candidatus Neptunochlamydia sp. REUL1]
MMLKRFGLISALCLTLFGCSSNNNYDQVTRFHDDGRAKPVVAFIPVFDRSDAQVGWSLSDEFTDQLRGRLQKQNSFYLNTPDEINQVVANLSAEDNPFSTNIDWIKDAFDRHEFVIFAELVEHDIHSKPLKGSFVDKITPSSELSLSMRIRVFDLRGSHPEVILQEFVHQDHLIPKPSKLNEPNPEKWKKMTFIVSPMGLAHMQFSKEVIKRVEDYILLSKSQ